jgi:integrase
VTPVKLRHLHYRHGAFYYVRRIGGKVVWKRLSADLSEAVRLWQAIEGETSRPLTRTVAAAIDRYLLHKAPDLAESTVAAYGKHRKRLEAAFAEFSDVSQIRSTHVYEYLDARSAKASGRQEIKLLSAVLGYVHRLGWITVNPCRGVEMPAAKDRRRVLSDGELAALREAANPRLRCLIDLALLTAMRQGDLLRLRLSDLTDEGIAVEHHKTGARVLYQWSDALREAVGRAKRLRRRVGSVYLFADERGAPVKSGAVQTAWIRLCRRVGVQDAHFHDLRATVLTLAKEKSGIDYAQALAGHASATMTESYVARRSVTKVRPIR